MRFAGALAWLAWLFVHILWVGMQNRLVGFIRWSLSFISRSRAQRLMTGEAVAADFEQAGSRIDLRAVERSS
jgi:NADH dehydrogenase